MKQAFNPYLPFNKCIPDGEPHVFGDRVYIYGSHDQEGGEVFCILDYEVFSASVTDLTDWRSEGIIYRAEQDPTYSEKYKYMYAPDVVQGNDGRFYLYYALAGGCFTGPIHVAVCDTPAGKYEYYGSVKNQDGSDFTRNITFDPGVINDDGVIRLYYGWALAIEGKINNNEMKEQRIQAEMMLFDKAKEEIEREPQGIQGANVVKLADDMLTVISEPSRIIPGQFDADGTGFEGHAFFEGSSIRKIGEKYYFIYSSEVQHELCYATSKYPDKEFVYGGVIVSNGDIGYEGRETKDRLAVTGNNHGSIECINQQWYIFYHRQTHKSTYSRQGCAEKITILPNGSIPQVEMTSCGLNSEPLITKGKYQSVIACNLTNGHMPHIDPKGYVEEMPYITHDGDERFITDIHNGTMIGYKYFSFSEPVNLEICVRGEASGKFEVQVGEEIVGELEITSSDVWKKLSTKICTEGVKPLYLKYTGEGKVDFCFFEFSK